MKGKNFDFEQEQAKKCNKKQKRTSKTVLCVGIGAVIALSSLTLWSAKTRGMLDDFELSHYPGISTVVHSDGSDEWQTIGEFKRNDNTGEVTDCLEYNHLTARHIVTCQANLSNDLEIRILDMDGNVLTESLKLTSDDIQSGKELSLDDVKTYEQYTVQYKYPYDAYFALNFQ